MSSNLFSGDNSVCVCESVTSPSGHEAEEEVESALWIYTSRKYETGEWSSRAQEATTPMLPLASHNTYFSRGFFGVIYRFRFLLFIVFKAQGGATSGWVKCFFPFHLAFTTLPSGSRNYL